MAPPKFKPQFRRLLFIDQAVRSGRHPNCVGLAREWETSAKTIQRDLDYLRDELGAPLVYDPARRGYRYDSDAWFLPSVLLTEGELVALLLGTQAAALYRGTPVAATLRQVFAKLAEALPGKISVAPELVLSRFSFAGTPARPVSEAVWTGLVRGLLYQRVVRMAYRSPAARAARVHVVHPCHVANIEGEWYLLAYSPRWNDVTPYAISRVVSAEVLAETFAPPPDFDAEALLRERWGKYLPAAAGGAAATVRLRFSPALAGYVGEKTWHPRQRLTARRDGGADLSFPVHDPLAVLPWVLSFGPEVRALGPARLVAAVRASLRAAAKGYR